MDDSTRVHSQARTLALSTSLYLLVAALQPAHASLVINELDYDQPGTDNAEFIELLNTGDSAISLTGYSLQLINGTTASPYNSFGLLDIMLPPGAYYVLCANQETTVNCNQDVSPNTNLMQNGAPDAVALLWFETLIDSLSYEGDLGIYTEGSGAGLLDTGTLAYLGLSRHPDGIDSNWNDTDFSMRCITPGYHNSPDAADCTTPVTVAPPDPVPLPPAILLMASGLAGLLHFGRKKRKN